MKNQNLVLTLSVDRTPEEVFAAIEDVRAWWGAGIEGTSRAVGDVFRYRYEELHDSTQQLVERIDGEKLVWLVTDAHLSFTKDHAEWKGTRLRFDIARKDGHTEVRFTHEGLVPEVECFEACSKGWGFYVGQSLESLLTTGKGKPDAKARARARAVAAG
jgi:hypothetical protein